MQLQLGTPVSTISQVGQTTSSRLKKIGIETVKDLIFYYPFRYEDFSQISDIVSLKPLNSVTVRGKIEMIKNRRSWKKKTFLTEALISDETGSVKAIWFNQPFLTKILKPGEEIYVSGRVDFDRYNLQFINPIYEKAKAAGKNIHTARIVPIYPVTEGLTQKQIRWLIKLALAAVNQIPDWLPAEIIAELKLPSLNQALEQIHFPDSADQADQAVHRLKFDELFSFLFQSKIVRQELKSSQAPPVIFHEAETKKFIDSLPFVLTADQKKVAWQIISDLKKDQPMNRLLEGEVGSGKTLVAVVAMLNVALTGYQGVLMVPTEVLAEQHFRNINNLLKATGVKVCLLTSANRRIGPTEFSKSKIFEEIKNGEVGIVIGTHALIQQDIEFNKLALVVIDEQHRFGVEQRKILHRKGLAKNIVPHFLSMTATPIPRSLALTLYGDLDLSVIKELPKERKKIITEIVDPADRDQCYDFIKQELQSGRQAFVICPLIDPSDKLGVKSVSEEYQRLKDNVFADFNIQKLHGRLKPAEKQQIMTDFLAKKSDILVATAVIEVGVDVPNATVIMIEGAERFGLAQLHQFRGRVGRSQYQSYCFLFSDSATQKTRERLQVLVEVSDGFILAQKDLAFRGPGEIFGLNQSGWPQFRIANIFDQSIIILAHQQLEKIMRKDPNLKQYKLLREHVLEINQSVHLE